MCGFEQQESGHEFAVSYPRLNKPAPAFTAKTTHGLRRLADYRGRWLVLFSHPSDFTPVCTTEFIAFANRFQEFQDVNCDLIGLSIDSVYSHLAWVRNISERFHVDIPFPIIDDLSMEVAAAYGMIQPGASETSTVRSLFVIDTEGILRAMIYYPMNVGRNIAEILRLVEALQFSDLEQLATPEAWQPGEAAIVPPPSTVDALSERIQDRECVDWYFCTRTAKTPAVTKPAPQT